MLAASSAPAESVELKFVGTVSRSVKRLSNLHMPLMAVRAEPLIVPAVGGSNGCDVSINNTSVEGGVEVG